MFAISRTRWHTRPLSRRAKRRSSAAPGSLRKKYTGIVHPPNMVCSPNHSTTSGDHRKLVLDDLQFALLAVPRIAKARQLAAPAFEPGRGDVIELLGCFGQIGALEIAGPPAGNQQSGAAIRWMPTTNVVPREDGRGPSPPRGRQNWVLFLDAGHTAAGRGGLSTGGGGIGLGGSSIGGRRCGS